LSARHSWPSIVAWLFVCISLFLQTSCATLFNHGRAMDVKIQTEPEGARIQLSGGAGECVKSPCVLNLNKDQGVNIVAKLQGFDESNFYLESRLSNWTLLNILWFTWPPIVIGFAVDYLSGSMWTLETDEVLIRMHPTIEEEPEPEPEAEEEKPTEPPCQELPVSADLAKVREAYADEFIMEQIDFYRGKLSADAKCKTKNLVLKNLMEMQKSGERLDIDEAFRREYFQRQGETALPN
jgi:hypothetical protein